MDPEVRPLPSSNGKITSDSPRPVPGEDRDTQPVPIVIAGEIPGDHGTEIPSRSGSGVGGTGVGGTGVGGTGVGGTGVGGTGVGGTGVGGGAPGQSGAMSSPVPPPDPGVRPGSGSWRFWSWRHWDRGDAIVWGAVAVVAVAAVYAAGGGAAGPGGTTRAVSVTEGSVSTVDLQGVPGQVKIVAVNGGRVRLAGQLHWTGHAPHAAARVGRGHVLWLSYRCAAASPCTEDYQLVVPRRTAVVLHQPSGHVLISGLAGTLRITAGSVNISAAGLRCPALAAVITSGHMSATFDTAPRKVSVRLTSAQATLRLPVTASYAVSSQVTSGYVHVGIPRDSTADRSVSALIDSGELELLPSLARPAILTQTES